MYISLFFLSLIGCRNDVNGFSTLGQTSVNTPNLNQGDNENDTGKADEEDDVSYAPEITGAAAEFVTAGGQGLTIEMTIYYSDQDKDIESCVGLTPEGEACKVVLSYSTDSVESETEEVDLTVENNVQFLPGVTDPEGELFFIFTASSAETHTFDIVLYDSVGNISLPFEDVVADPDAN